MKLKDFKAIIIAMNLIPTMESPEVIEFSGSNNKSVNDALVIALGIWNAEQARKQAESEKIATKERLDSLYSEAVNGKELTAEELAEISNLRGLPLEDVEKQLTADRELAKQAKDDALAKLEKVFQQKPEIESQLVELRAKRADLLAKCYEFAAIFNNDAEAAEAAVDTLNIEQFFDYPDSILPAKKRNYKNGIICELNDVITNLNDSIFAILNGDAEVSDMESLVTAAVPEGVEFKDLEVALEAVVTEFKPISELFDSISKIDSEIETLEATGGDAQKAHLRKTMADIDLVILNENRERRVNYAVECGHSIKSAEDYLNGIVAKTAKTAKVKKDGTISTFVSTSRAETKIRKQRLADLFNANLTLQQKKQITDYTTKVMTTTGIGKGLLFDAVTGEIVFTSGGLNREGRFITMGDMAKLLNVEADVTTVKNAATAAGLAFNGSEQDIVTFLQKRYSNEVRTAIPTLPSLEFNF